MHARLNDGHNYFREGADVAWNEGDLFSPLPALVVSESPGPARNVVDDLPIVDADRPPLVAALTASDLRSPVRVSR